jgi:hypothetical protein
MKAPLHTLLLITITFTLAFAPLRGVLAIAAVSSGGNDSHCAGMMHSMPSPDSSTPHHTVTQNSEDEDCCHQCDGGCTDSDCVDCVHSGIAITNTVSIHPDSHSTPQTSPLLVRYPPGNFTPPYRPPVSI